MGTKSYKTILLSGAWVLVLLVLVISMGFVNQTRKQAKCAGLSIYISNEEGNYFIDEDDIREYIYQNSGDPIGQQVDKIDLNDLELQLGEMDVVRNAEVYVDLKGHINIEIEQRIPIARIYLKDGSSFYMDDIGQAMPLSNKYTARVIVVNGKVPQPTIVLDQDELVNPEWKELFSLINSIKKDAFFNAQFEQVFINSSREYELTPRVGRHSILLGRDVSIDKKFKKLKLFYKEGIAKVDWNKYEQIDLRFSDQIVCAKR